MRIKNRKKINTNLTKAIAMLQYAKIADSSLEDVVTRIKSAIELAKSHIQDAEKLIII